MTTTIQDELKQRVGRAMVGHAVFRIESALTIALSILLAFFLPRPLIWWRWWMWLVLGAIAETLIVYTSLTDPRTNQRVVAQLLRDRFQPRGIRTRAYREKVVQAHEYREGIQGLIAQLPAGVLRDHLRDTTQDLAEWIGSMYTIAQRLDEYARDELLHRDVAQTPTEIRDLRRALALENDAQVKRQIEATLQAKEALLDNLDHLENRMEQAQFRLDQTLTAMGTIYSQFQLLRAQKLSDGRAQRLSTDIQEQVRGLQDILTTMDEVYNGHRIASP